MDARFDRDIHGLARRHGRGGCAHRLEGAGDVQGAASEDDVRPRIAQVRSGAQQDVHRFTTGQIGEGLQQQGQGARHGG